MNHPHGFSTLPPPPYYAVIFSSQRNGADEDGYAATAAQLFDAVHEQPGFLGAESARDARGFGITVAYFDSEAAIAAWRDDAAHAAAREHGRRHWYHHYELRIACVERAYGARTPAAITEASA